MSLDSQEVIKYNDCIISVKLAKESFELCRMQDYSNVFGSIDIICSDELPEELQIRIIGEEMTGSKISYILDDIYHFTSIHKDCIQYHEGKYELPFNISIPSNIPSSIQLNQLDGIYYYLKIEVANKTITQPIHLHHTLSVLRNEKAYWGIAHQQDTKWQYEIEFPNIYNLVNSSDFLCIRFKSISQQNLQQLADCCLFGFQIIQSIHKEGRSIEHQILVTETKILTKLNSTWNEPYILEFSLLNSHDILPTISTEHIEVQHDIKLTLAWSNEHAIHLNFPVILTGYHPTLVQQNLSNYRLIHDTIVLSSNSSVNSSKEEKDSAIDINSYGSFTSSILYK